MNDVLFENAQRFHQAGNLSEAMRLYRQVLRFNPRNFQALSSLAMGHFQTGQFEEAARLFGEAAAIDPASFDVWYNRGCAFTALKRHAEAITSFDQALVIAPHSLQALVNRSMALFQLGRIEEGVVGCDRALALDPDNLGVLAVRAGGLMWLERYEDALATYDRILAVRPDDVEALRNRGDAQAKLRRFEEALESYGHALSKAPDDIELLINRATALLDLHRLDEALASFTQSLNVRPGNPEAWASRGRVLTARWQFAEAVASFDKAISIKPDAALYGIRAEALCGAGRIEDAIRDCETVLKWNPDYPFVRGNLAFWHLVCCDWRTLEAEKSEIGRRLRLDQPVIDPFMNLTLSSSAADQLRCAQVWAKKRYLAEKMDLGPKASLPSGRETHPPASHVPSFEHHFKHDRIRLGYFSADFCNHATAHLVAELFERHDRAKFELIAFSFGLPTRDAVRERLEKSFERFIEVGTLSDHEVASLARRLEVDIAVDLKGYTRDSRTEIFARRAAPIQVNYLGYPGTMGVDTIDYIVADPTLIPEEEQQYYAEKIVYLPDTYQANDSLRSVADKPFTRAEFGLPEAGFVFCSFNNNYKITPKIFDVWMRLLGRNEGSVLWLLKDNAAAAKNLRAEAQARGIAPLRIVFAGRIDHSEHLARHRLADLLLDTLPYNAHTTASDALWLGLPVLTCLGETFPGRVAASLLKAIGLPELITRDLAEYEALALELAANPQRLQAVRQKLAANRLTHPLFDAARFTKHIESAYVSMWERHRAGLAPRHIHVPSEIDPSIGAPP